MPVPGTTTRTRPAASASAMGSRSFSVPGGGGGGSSIAASGLRSLETGSRRDHAGGRPAADGHTHVDAVRFADPVAGPELPPGRATDPARRNPVPAGLRARPEPRFPRQLVAVRGIVAGDQEIVRPRCVGHLVGG